MQRSLLTTVKMLRSIAQTHLKDSSQRCEKWPACGCCMRDWAKAIEFELNEFVAVHVNGVCLICFKDKKVSSNGTYFKWECFSHTEMAE